MKCGIWTSKYDLRSIQAASGGSPDLVGQQILAAGASPCCFLGMSLLHFERGHNSLHPEPPSPLRYCNNSHLAIFGGGHNWPRSLFFSSSDVVSPLEMRVRVVLLWGRKIFHGRAWVPRGTYTTAPVNLSWQTLAYMWCILI